jgi:hypothetical protein
VQPSRQALSYLEQKTASIQSAEFQYSPTKKEEAEQVAFFKRSFWDRELTNRQRIWFVKRHCGSSGHSITAQELLLKSKPPR